MENTSAVTFRGRWICRREALLHCRKKTDGNITINSALLMKRARMRHEEQETG
jgi:hypothetical protein